MKLAIERKRTTKKNIIKMIVNKLNDKYDTKDINDSKLKTKEQTTLTWKSTTRGKPHLPMNDKRQEQKKRHKNDNK